MPDWLREPPTMEQDKAALATETHGTVNREDAGVSSAWRPRFFDELAAMQAQQHLETEEVTDPNLSGAAPLPGTPTDVALDVGSEDETQPFAVPEEWPAGDASSDEDAKADAVPEEMGEISDEEESIDDDPTSTPALDFLAEVESLFGKDVSSASSVSDQGVFVDLLPDVQFPTEESTSPSGDAVLEDAPETVEPLSSETISEVSDDASQVISVTDMNLDEFPESPTSTEPTPVAEDIVTFVAEAVAPQPDVSSTESPSTGFEVSPTQMDELVRLGGAVQVDQSNQGLEVARVAEIAAAMKEDVDVLSQALTDSDDTVPVDQAMDALGKTFSELEQRLSGFAALERETMEGVTAFQNELHHVHGLSAEEWFDRHPDTRFALGHVLLVRSNTMVWGLPVAVVDEIVPASDSIDDGAAKVLGFDGAEIAYAPLDTLIGPSDGEKTTSGPIVVLGVDGHRFGIQVDAVLGQKRVVRQAAEPFLGGLTYLGGTAVLDGNTAISVLEARALAHQASVSAHMD